MSNKPQLILYDGVGEQNKDLEKSRARLLKGGSWLKQRIIMLIPAGDTIPAKVCLSWINLAFPPNQGVMRMLVQGMEVGDAYSTAIEQILAHPDLSQFEYILTVEHDNCPPGDGVIRLLERMEEHPEFSAIGGLYWCKGPGGCSQIWGDIKDPILNYRPQVPDLNGGVVECYGVAQGFTLFRTSMFKDPKLPRPLFKTMNGKDGQGVGTQDLMFWNNARKLGYRCAIDCGCKVGHYDLKGDFGPSDMMW